MTQKILITGSTDGIGWGAARMLVTAGHHVLLHGRNPEKLEQVRRELAELHAGTVEAYVADLSRMGAVRAFAGEVTERHENIDVLVNNAGVFRARSTVTPENLDVRFAVNTLAPYLLTRSLLPLLGPGSRVVNVTSAAQASVDTEALAGRVGLSDGAAYAQSKLALTMWTRQMADSHGDDAPTFVAVNPGSMLGTKMVKEAFGVSGGDVRIGAEILTRAAISEEFGNASGRYFDNDAGQFATPHPDVLDADRVAAVVRSIDGTLARLE